MAGYGLAHPGIAHGTGSALVIPQIYQVINQPVIINNNWLVMIVTLVKNLNHFQDCNVQAKNTVNINYFEYVFLAYCYMLTSFPFCSC